MSMMELGEALPSRVTSMAGLGKHILWKPAEGLMEASSGFTMWSLPPLLCREEEAV